MLSRMWLTLSLLAVLFAPSLLSCRAPACCAVSPSGKPVLNADQTVLMIWDAASKTQHFIRQASFKSEADDFGFLVPTPSQPELEESGNEAFPFLLKLTEPETKKATRPSRGMSCGCGESMPMAAKSGDASVRVLEEKQVAGFHAAVLEADSANALVGWLKEHGYTFSPEVEAWAKPYIGGGWKITALKVAKDKENKEKQTVAASALRLSFKTDRPLFPYREPDPKSLVDTLKAKHRLLRVYFLSDARYEGELGQRVPWKADVAWANRLPAGDRNKLLQMLKLPTTAAPAECWLTELEHDWPYKLADADVYFTRAADQSSVKRPPIIIYTGSPVPTDVTVYAFAAVMVLPLIRRFRRK